MSDTELLEKLFHEPSRLAILSELAAVKELTFTELRDRCSLTDGNLSRHLKMLEEAGTVAIRKEFVGVKPQTTIRLTTKGLAHFSHYLEALEVVLKNAKNAIKPTRAAAMKRDAENVKWPNPAPTRS